MKSALLRMRKIKDDVSPTQKIILDYIIENPHKVTKMSIRDLAHNTYASSSTIVRLCRLVGFDGFIELKQAILVDLATLESYDSNKDIEESNSIDQIISKVTESNINSLKETKAIIDEKTIETCIDLLAKSRNVIIFGIGSSYCVGEDMFLKLLRINHPCQLSEDLHSQRVMAKNSTNDDVALIFSYSGETKEMIESLKLCKENNTPTIAVTRYAKTPISNNADYVLYVSAAEPLFRKGAMSSRIAQLNIIDILYTGLVNREYDYSMKQLVSTHIEKENNKY